MLPYYLEMTQIRSVPPISACKALPISILIACTSKKTAKQKRQTTDSIVTD